MQKAHFQYNNHDIRNKIIRHKKDDGKIGLIFSKEETVEQQIRQKQNQLKNSNLLNEIVGQWPGDESVDEILNELD